MTRPRRLSGKNRPHSAMWLLPLLSRVAALAVGSFYRLTVSGGPVPPRGPVLLVSNHPNSLIDPALVAAVSGRPVRFLAKAPLFRHPHVGWLVRGAGAIPVYRSIDGPSESGSNEESFRAVHAALLEGAAVGIFPEGLSHSDPSIAPLKTGAARIALGAAANGGAATCIVPVGLTFREKETFRSEALVVIGAPVRWSDLRASPRNPDAVRELTRRIEDALRSVTLNLERWEDAPLVELAEEIHAAEIGGGVAPPERLARLREVSELLRRLRTRRRTDWAPIAREIERHGRILRAMGLRPADLHRPARLRSAAPWILRRAALLLVGPALAILGTAVFQVPYRLTGMLEAASAPARDVRATHKLLLGAVLHLAWSGALAIAAGLVWGPFASLATLLGLPVLGIVTLHVRGRWESTIREARVFLQLRRKRHRRVSLALRQREIAERLRALHAGAGISHG